MPPHSTTLLPRINSLTLIEDLERTTARFWRYVNQTGPCWIWTGGTTHGYGHLSVKVAGRHRRIDAHRFSYLLAYGSIPTGLHICHACDAAHPAGDTSYRRCVRPEHLWAGTPGDNVRDAFSKGRMPTGDDHYWRRYPERIVRGAKKARSGEVNGRGKLTQAQVEEIRMRYAAGGITQIDLAQEYGMSQPGISHILCRDSWRHV